MKVKVKEKRFKTWRVSSHPRSCASGHPGLVQAPWPLLGAVRPGAGREGAGTPETVSR